MSAPNALEGSPPGTSAVAIRQGTFEVNGNGQATYRIPLELPPGIASSNPTPELAYVHGQGNGVLGVGWVLSALSAITRVKATYAVDGFNGAVAYDENDRFSLDGQRLINVDGAYGAPGTVYYTELQTWDHVKAGASPLEGFTVVAKSGATRHYGTTPDSRILAAGGEAVRVWALSATTDLNGNRIDYHYTLAPDGGPADTGAYYLDQISYTSRDDGTVANRFVRFAYEPRPDPIADFIGGHPVTMLFRLEKITVSIAGDEIVRSYSLNYRTGNATGSSQIESIAEAGASADGTSELPPINLAWQDVEAPSFTVNPPSTLDQHLGQADVRPMDVAGTGRTDLVQLWVDNNGDLHATTYLARTAAGGNTTFDRAADSTLGAFPQTRQVLPMDVNGDGRTDLVVAYASGPNNALRLAAFLSDGSGFVAAGAFDTGDTWTAKHLAFFPMDANGDGRTDLVEAYAHFDPNQGDLLYLRSYLSMFGDDPSKMFTEGIVSPTEDPANPTALLAFWPMDVNGDGMMDLVRVWQRSDQSMIATAYVSVSTAIDDVSFAATVESDLGTFSLPDQIAFLPVDVNGNGIQDLLHVWQQPGPGRTTLHLTTFLCDAAGGFTVGPDSTFENQTLDADGLYPMDLDGSGQTALVGKWISGDHRLMFTPFRPSPDGRYRAFPPFDAGLAGSAVELAIFFPGDVNGDGKADLIRVSLDDNQQLRVVPYVSSGPRPDLVSAITDQLGGTVSIHYAPLSDDSVYTPAAEPSFPAGPGRRYANPLTPAVFPVQAVLGQAVYVVSSYTEENDPLLNRFPYSWTTVMAYSGAQLDLLGRGWQGFQTVSSRQQATGRSVVTTYNQAFPYTGTQASERVEADGTVASDPRVPDDDAGALLTRNQSDYTAVTRATGATAPHPPVVEVLKVASRLEFFDYGVLNFDYALGQTYAYDGYGNQTFRANLGYIDPATDAPLEPADVVYRHCAYQNDVSSDGWALGYLTYVKESANADDPDITRFLPGDYHLDRRTYTPATYNLATQSQWDDVNNVYLTRTFTYDQFGNRIADSEPGNFVTRYEYDPDYHTFLMCKTTPPDEQGVPLVVTYGYDPRFNVEVARTDANGHVWVTGLDGFGRRALRQGPVPDPQGGSDPNALTPLVTGAADIKSVFLGATVVTLETTEYVDDGQGGLFTQVRALQTFPTGTAREFVWTRSYVDGRALERETVQESGQQEGNVVILKDYDADAKPVVQSVPFFSPSLVVSTPPYPTTTTYDVLGRPLTMSVPAGPDGSDHSVTVWAYDRGSVVTETNAAGSDTPYVRVLEHHVYDGIDRVRRMTVDPDGENATSSFDYDPVARLVRASDPPTSTNPQGVSNTIVYDSLNRRTSVDNPDQNTTGNPSVKAMSYLYDSVTGCLSRQQDAVGQVTDFRYDEMGRLVHETLGDGRTIAFTYDDAATNGRGRLSTVVLQTADQQVQSGYDFAYDKYGNQAGTSLTLGGEGVPFDIRRVFDPQQRTVRQTFPDGTALTRQYSFEHLVSQSLDGARADYPLDHFDPWALAGRSVFGQGTLPGQGVVADYTFNPCGQVYGEVVSGAAGEVVNFSYSYDLLNQLLRADDRSGGGQSQVFTYRNRRLTSATVPGLAEGTYQYDQSGNLLDKDGISFQYRAHFPQTGTSGNQTVYSATQDACGRTEARTVNGQALQFGYDGLGCLARVATPEGVTLRRMVSDYLGRLVRQVDADGEVVLFVDDAYQVRRSPGGGESITKYLIDDRGTAASVVTGGLQPGIVYFRRDFKGSNTHAFGPAGTVVAVYAYGGYGQPRRVSGTEEFEPKYEHRPWHAEIGLYYFGARYFDPLTGRFLTPDTQLGESDLLRADALNRFAFELNNPVNLVDPTGRSSDWIYGLVIGLTIVAAGVLIIATAGAATPLVAAGLGVSAATAGTLIATAGGAALGAGLAGSSYSLTHRSVSGGRFWAGYVVNVGVGAVVGGVTGGVGTVVGNAVQSATATIVSTGLQFAARASAYVAFGVVSTAGGDTLSQFMSDVVDRYIVGDTSVSLSDGLARAAITGAVFGTVAGVGQAAAEVRYLKITYGPDELNVQPIELQELGASTETTPLKAGNWYSRPNVDVETTFKTRAVLFSISGATMVADTTLQGWGY